MTFESTFADPKKLREELMKKTNDKAFVDVAMKIHKIQNPQYYKNTDDVDGS